MEATWILISIIVVLCSYFYWFQRKKYKYWEERGVTAANPAPLIGSLVPVITLQKSVGEVYKDIYEEYPNEKVVGLFEIFKPVLIVKDPSLIEKILVKDFQHFVDHAQIVDDGSLFSTGLFQLKGTTWRAIRYKLSPAFTSGKLKQMFNNMLNCSNGMMKVINQNLNKDYELKDALSSYTIDVIANVVFGIQMENEATKREFSKMGRSVFDVTPLRFINILLLGFFPRLSKMIGIRFLSKEASDYFQGLIKNTIEMRQNETNRRNDYMDHIMKLKEKGTIELQSKDEDDSYLDLDGKPPVENIEFSEQILYGQAFQFLTAGFDPLFNTITFTLYDMARFPETQERARKEIREALANNGGFTYQALKEMTYLEQCVQETLRIHPLTPFLFRECSKNYKTDSGLEIEKGIKIIIPINAMHMDPKHYENPDEFNPERLPPNSIRNSYTYIPFGDGPRMCIGLRFAIVELKIGLARLLENHRFKLSPKTKIPFEVNKMAFIPLPTSKILFNIELVK